MLVIMSVTRRGDEVNMVHVYIILEHVHTAGASVFCSLFGGCQYIVQGFYHWCQWECSFQSFPSLWVHILEQFVCINIAICSLHRITERNF